MYDGINRAEDRQGGSGRGEVVWGVWQMSRWVGGWCLPAPMGSLAEMGALLGAHASKAPSSGTGYTPAHNTA